MKRSFFGRYARYISFLLSSIIFLYAGVGLVFYYAGEFETDQTFASLAKRVAAVELAEETTDQSNATVATASILGSAMQETGADGALTSPSGVATPAEVAGFTAASSAGASADGAQGVGASSLTDTQPQAEPAGQGVVAQGGAGQGNTSGNSTGGTANHSPATATATPKPVAAATPAPTKSGVIDILQGLYAENPDLGGWITISGTVIDYPVMYTPRDPEKYIRLSFKGDVSSSGVPFIGKGCKISPQSDNIIIYGHNMRKGTMFASLLSYKSANYYQQHPTIRFSTLYNTGNYDIVAAFQTDVYNADTLRCYQFINAQNASDFNNFIDTVKSASMYNTGVTATYGDQLLTLSTCSYHTTDGRFVVVARKRK